MLSLVGSEMCIRDRFNFGQPRVKVIDRAVNKAFEMLQKEILKNVL
jgi:nicotinamide-nucleotide amidase